MINLNVGNILGQQIGRIMLDELKLKWVLLLFFSKIVI